MAVDAAGQAANAAALAEEIAMLGAFVAITDGGGVAGLEKAAIKVVSKAKRLLSHKGSGVTYQRGNVSHTASAPGEPPAVDTGRLRASMDYKLNKAEKYVDIGTNVTYAPMLEYGTSRMDARPFLRPAVEQTRADVQAQLVAEIVKAQTAALKGFGKAIGKIA